MSDERSSLNLMNFLLENCHALGGGFRNGIIVVGAGMLVDYTRLFNSISLRILYG